MELSFIKKRAKEINKVILIPVDEILPNPNQPRKYFDEVSINELCQSIVCNGLLQPITVREKDSGEYELIAGERRLIAYRKLARNQIPAIVEEYTEQQSSAFALIENMQRKDLNYFEEALAIDKLMREFGLNQQQTSLKLGKAQSTVANKLRLLKLPTDVREKILESGLTERHARAILKLPDLNNLKYLEHIIANKLNVEQTEAYIDECLKESESKKKNTRLFIIKDMRIFLNSIDKAIKLMQSAGIDVDSQKVETDKFVEMVIRIPKAAIYKRKEAAQ